MRWNIKNNCENCDFRVKQFDVEGQEVNMCILNNKQVGLIETCEKYKPKTGEHFSN